MPTQIKEKPIIFSTPMVQAILNGTKTQSRRVIKPQPYQSYSSLSWDGNDKSGNGRGTGIIGTNEAGLKMWLPLVCPYGQAGDRLWVRETFWAMADGKTIYYKATVPFPNFPFTWKPSIHMPRWASRITLEITGIRVERVQDISHEDARAEGVIPMTCCLPDAQHYFTPFKELWDSINAKHSWESNPWVWVIEFKKVTGDAVMLSQVGVTPHKGGE